MHSSAPTRERGYTFGVFLANYNHAQYLRQALDALLAQSLQPDTIHVVDDRSSDDSRAVIQDYAARYPVIQPVFNDINRGYHANARSWLEASTHDFVYFAAADDYTLPGFFEKTIGLLRENPEAGLCSALCYMLDNGDAVAKVAPSPILRNGPGFVGPRDVSMFLHREGSWLWGTTTIYRREHALRHGGFNFALHGFADGFLSTLIGLHHGVCFIPEPLAVWRRFFSDSISAETFRDVKKAQDVLAKVLRHLETDLKDIVQPGFAERFTKRWIYAFIERQATNPATMDVPAIQDAVRPYLPVVAWLLPWILRLPPAPSRQAVLALTLRPFDVLPALVRRFKHPPYATNL